jgi:hypothetical protein
MNAAFKRILIAVALAALLPIAALAADSYRWVDPDSGETMYSPTPPKNPDIPYDLLRDGVVIERYQGSEKVETPESEYEAAREAEEAKRRADALLLMQYKNCAAIEAAMDEELDGLRYDYTLLDGTYASLKKSMIEQIGVAADRQRAGLAVANHDLDKFESIRGRMAENRVSRDGLALREQRIRDEYGAKRARYQQLLQQQPDTPSDC